MTDIVDKQTRSRMMSLIRGRHTKPERMVRRYLHASGLRYRLHVADLPGKPDIVLPRFSAVVEVRGCFWHQHPGCQFAYMPKSNRAFWQAKLSQNVARDHVNEQLLRRAGWRVFVTWECQVDNETTLRRLARAITKTRTRRSTIVAAASKPRLP